MIKKNMKPFLRWAGGKVYLINKLLRFVPEDFRDRLYREPFLGGGSMFFALSPPKAIISDFNLHLIHCYRMVRDHPETVNSYLLRYARDHSATLYYKIRSEYNESNFTIKQAARFIYLNKTSFNGIFRVNKNGQFNVPYGKKDDPVWPTLKQLRESSKNLKRAQIYDFSYETILENSKKDEFIYLDPPYPPLNGTSYFTHYTKERFCDDDQKQLSEIAQDLNSRGCLVMISNADTPDTRKLYKGWNISELPVTRWITCKSNKHKVNELIITNYSSRGKNHD